VDSAGQRLFLIDGYGLIYRAFYAMMGRPLRTSRGENTSAVYAVAQFLLRLFERYRPAFIAWVHDAGTSFRHETYPQYKATRERLEPELQADFDRSVERVEQLLAALRVPLIVVPGYEADDVMGTLAAQAAGKGVSAVLVSGDKDLYQMVSDGISLLNPGRGGPAAIDEQWIDRSNAADRLGVPPERVVDYLALVGDTSDNVPGVKGIGDKTARELISKYGDLDAILAQAASVEGKRAREALLSGGEEARLSRELVRIRRDVPVELDLNALAVSEPDPDALRRLLSELEFHELLQKLDLGQPRAVAVATELLADSAGLGALVRRLTAAPIVAVVAPPAGLALAVEGESWYLPLDHGVPQGELLTERRPANLPPLSDPRMRPLVEALQNPAIPKAGHGVKDTWLLLRRAGIELRGVQYDSRLASFLLDPGRRSHSLEVLALEILGLRFPPAGDEPPAETAPANAAQRWGAGASAVLQLKARFDSELDRLALRRLMEDVELPLVEVLVDMEWRGIAIDVNGLAALSREFGEELGRLEREIHHEAGVDFNINSTAQLRHVLFEKLQLPVIKRTKTGASTDADVLEQLAAMGFAVPTLLLEYRELTKLKSTYVDVLPARVNPATGRIHTSFHQTGAATGRLSSSDPNLQNIPVRTSRGERIRGCFIPGPGCRLVVADYSQIELRLLAHLSEDEAFITAFQRGGDIHRETAAIIFGVPVAGVTSEMRARAKTINFATIYGQGPFALSRQLGITQDEAKEFIRLYFERFAGVRRFLDGTIQRAREQGYVETLFGRRRYIPELQDPSYNVRAFGERTAMNSPLQGSAADLIKIAMISLHRALRQQGLTGGILLQVHDELVLEAPEAEAEQAATIVRREMEAAATLRVPLVADVGIGPNWLEAKP
jgi:DNA polymerase-1